MAAKGEHTLELAPERETKGTWRFAEVGDGEFTVYISKPMLQEMGWTDGNLQVTFTVKK